MSQNVFWDEVCKNFENLDKDSYNIGYAHTKVPFIIFPCISIVLNLIIILTYVRRTCDQRRKTIQQRDSMEKMLYFMTFFELILSLYWLINGIVFYSVR